MGRGSSKASGRGGTGANTTPTARPTRGAGGVPANYEDALNRRRQAAVADDMNDEYSEAIAFASDGYYPDGTEMDTDARDLDSIVANGLLGDDYSAGREYREAVSDVLGGLRNDELHDVQTALRNGTHDEFARRASEATGRLRNYYEDMATLALYAADKMNDDFGQTGVRFRRRS